MNIINILFENDTIQSNGERIIDVDDFSSVVLLINILNNPTGTNPTIVFTIVNVDPVDQTTIIGNAINTNIITTSVTTSIKFNDCKSSTIKVSWSVTGTNFPQFTGVNISLITKNFVSEVSISSNNTNVSASTSNVTILSANSNRLNATIFNDSLNILYLKLGVVASTTSFTVKIPAGSYYELPIKYIGVIDGIWDGTDGAARVTELI